MTGPPRPGRGPADPATQPGIRATVQGALQVIVDHPRQVLLPILVVQVPVAVIAALVTLVASLTVLRDEPIDPFADGSRGALFLFAVTTAAELLFSQVARGAAVTAIAGAAVGRRVGLAESLDPAFSRMGGLIVLTLGLALLAAPIVVPFVGWVIAPYLALRSALSFEAFMLERRSPIQAIVRSWQITRTRVLRLLGVIFLSAVLLLVPILVVSLLGALVAGSRTTQAITGAVYSVVQGVFIVPFVAFLAATTTLFYLTSTGAFRGRSAVRV